MVQRVGVLGQALLGSTTDLGRVHPRFSSFRQVAERLYSWPWLAVGREAGRQVSRLSSPSRLVSTSPREGGSKKLGAHTLEPLAGVVCAAAPSAKARHVSHPDSWEAHVFVEVASKSHRKGV